MPTLAAMWRRAAREPGEALIIFAAGLAGFCGLAGASVDIGHLAYARNHLQRVADAAALAAGQDLPDSPANALTTAGNYATLNGSSPADIEVGFSEGNAVVAVTAKQHIDFWFLKVIGIAGADVSANAASRVTEKTITGWRWNDVAPFVIWGGARRHEVHAGDAACPLHVCIGSSYPFLDANWTAASGTPTAPDWTASSPSTFRGDVSHADSAAVGEVGDVFLDAGGGSGTLPSAGQTLVIPIVDKAAESGGARSFHVAAWAVVVVDSGCARWHCTGTVQPLAISPPPGWDTAGAVLPPTALRYRGGSVGLIG
jgi:Flp pilus assembly protein TadG